MKSITSLIILIFDFFEFILALCHPTLSFLFPIVNLTVTLAEFENAVIRERANSRIKATRARCRVGGYPTKLNPKIIAKAKAVTKIYK